MKVAEIRELTTNDLVERIATEETRYTQLMLQHAVSPLENPAQIRALRRTIARMKTILRERELNNK